MEYISTSRRKETVEIAFIICVDQAVMINSQIFVKEKPARITSFFRNIGSVELAGDQPDVEVAMSQVKVATCQTAGCTHHCCENLVLKNLQLM